jgi:hypothetical protein
MLMAKSTEPDSLAYLLDAPPSFGKRKDCSGVESCKGCRFATSTGSGKSVFVSATMMSSIDFDYESLVL